MEFTCVQAASNSSTHIGLLLFRFLTEKTKEIWWKKLLEHESDIDVKQIDCSRPFDELSEETQAHLQQIQYDEQQKMKGKRQKQLQGLVVY